MDTSQKAYTDLALWAVRSEDQGLWSFGVTMDGADVVLFGRKLGGVDSDLETVRLAAQQAERTPPTPVPPTL